MSTDIPDLNTMIMFIDHEINSTTVAQNSHIAHQIIMASGVASSSFNVKGDGSQIKFNSLSETIIKSIYAYLISLKNVQ